MTRCISGQFSATILGDSAAISCVLPEGFATDHDSNCYHG